MRARRRSLTMMLLLGAALSLGAARCASDGESRPSSVVIKDSPESLLADASSIYRAEIVRNRPLTVSEDGSETACGFVHEVRVVDRLRGPGYEVVLGNEELSPGQHYLVAVLDLKGKLPPTTASSIDERDRAYLQCRKQLPRYVLGWARFESSSSDRLLVSSSTIIPEELRRASVGGLVHLDAIRDFVGAKAQD